MDYPIRPTSFDRKIEFLKVVIESAEKRRDAVENKFSILIAANAILLSIIIGVGLSSVARSNPIYWTQFALTAVALGSVLLSILWCAQVLSPLSQKQRSKIMDVPDDAKLEHNLYLFMRIADLSKVDYSREITALTEPEFFEQLLAEAHNLSRLLVFRYKVLGRANMMFAAGAVIFTILALTNLLG
jgi:hypothetical protein